MNNTVWIQLIMAVGYLASLILVLTAYIKVNPKGRNINVLVMTYTLILIIALVRRLNYFLHRVSFDNISSLGDITLTTLLILFAVHLRKFLLTSRPK